VSVNNQPYILFEVTYFADKVLLHNLQSVDEYNYRKFLLGKANGKFVPVLQLSTTP
jgi:hypothetical protein